MGEQSLVQTLNAQVKFKHGRVSEAVVFDVQTSTRMNCAHGDVGHGVEVLEHADENSDCTDRTQENSDSEGFSLGAPRGDTL